MPWSSKAKLWRPDHFVMPCMFVGSLWGCDMGIMSVISASSVIGDPSCFLAGFTRSKASLNSEALSTLDSSVSKSLTLKVPVDWSHEATCLATSEPPETMRDTVKLWWLDGVCAFIMELIVMVGLQRLRRVKLLLRSTPIELVSQGLRVVWPMSLIKKLSLPTLMRCSSVSCMMRSMLASEGMPMVLILTSGCCRPGKSLEGWRRLNLIL